MPIATIDNIRINISSDPNNYTGHEDELSQLIDDLERVYRTEDHDVLLRRAISLKNRGVFFPPHFMMVTARGRASYRPPSEQTLDSSIPGYSELRDEIKREWPKLYKDKACEVTFKRLAMCLYLSTDVKDLLHITPDAFEKLIRLYKDDVGFWDKGIFPNDTQSGTLNKMAEGFARINNSQKYRDVCRQPRIEKGSIGGDDYIKANILIQHPPADIKKWVKLYKSFEDSEDLAVSNTRPFKAAFKHLIDWIRLYDEETRSDPLRFLLATKRSPSLCEYMKLGKSSMSKQSSQTVSILVRFTEWIRQEHLADEDEEGLVVLGQPLILPNDFNKLKGAWRTDDAKGNTAKSVPLPAPWRIKLREILRRNNYEFARSIDDQYFEWENPETGKLERQWIPTLAYAFDMMLEVPLRMMQILCLDSGEGDETRYDPSVGAWMKNDGPCSGWWKNDPDAKIKHRGVLKKMGTPIKPIVGMNINTNKTAANNARYGEAAGYEIPWQNEYTISLINSLRQWQEKYNPAEEPLPFSGVAESVFGYSPSKAILEMSPARFYLFRSPNSKGNRMAPPSYRQRYDFWLHLLDQLEKELRAEGEDVTLISVRKPNGQPQTAAYHIHGLRVALITAFAEAGVPIEVLSKLVVGHSTILMTLYYIHHNEASISALLSEKALQMEANAEEKMKEILSQATWKEAMEIAVYNDENAFRKTLESDILPYWTNVGYGFCPNGSGRCHEGGEPLNDVKNEKDRKYGPVPGGSQNCLRCRFFITGLPFALRLWLKVNKTLADTKKIAIETDELDAELTELYTSRRAAIKSKTYAEIKASMHPRIKELEAQLEMKTEKLDQLGKDLHAGHRSLQKIEEKVAKGDETGMALVAHSGVELRPEYREGTRFELTTILNKAAEEVPFLRDSDLEREQQMFLDKILLRENLTPLCLAPLSPDVKRKAANAASLWLLENVGAREVDQIHNGEISMKELGWDSDTLIKSMENLVGPLLADPENTPKLIGSNIDHG